MTLTITETLPEALLNNVIGAHVQSDQRLLDEALKTSEVNKELLLEAKNTIAKQTQELTSCKASLVQFEAARQKEIAALKAEMAAKVASLQQINDSLSNDLAYQKRCVSNLSAELTNTKAELTKSNGIVACFKSKYTWN